MKDCSETMLLEVTLVGIYIYMFTNNQKTRLMKDKKNLSIFHEFLEIC